VVDMSLNDVVKLIRGKAGTVVRLKVIPLGKGEAKIYNITRAKIELKNSEARSEILESGKKENGQPYKIGFIDLPGFYMDMEGARAGTPDFKSCTRDVRRLLEKFNEQQVDAVIIDLRRDGGGALNEAISLTGLFIDTGPVVQVKDSKGVVQHYDDQDPGVAWKGPLVVLQSKFSASASEIFAGAIQDYRRGLVIGDHSSHGKGTVQSMLDVGQSLFFIPNAPSLGALKITIQQFYRPDGDSTQMRGVLSDVELPALSTHLPVGEGDLDYALKFDHVDPVPYTPVGMVDPDLVKQLQTLSADRIKRSTDFAKVEKNIDRYMKQKDRKKVSLNREKFLAERADMDVDKEEEKEFDDSNAKRPVVKRDFYIEEVLGITDDYIRLSHVKVLATN
jgi:carboxyl-terminal processing protease